MRFLLHPESRDDLPPARSHGDRGEGDQRQQKGRLNWGQLSVLFLLLAATLLVYWPLHDSQFVYFDDDEYVFNNPHVRTGLKWTNVVWAFTTFQAANYHPLTWLSHMVDCQLFGPDAGRHHLVSVFIHLLNTLLLYAMFRRLTNAGGRSIFIAALFALHPLHVESVAWIAERKDVLSTLFGLAAIHAYVSYVQGGRRLSFAIMHLFFAFSLLSKPMLVTLPALLILLDLWPLERLPRGGGLSAAWPLIKEKLLLVALASMAATATYGAQETGGAVQEVASFPLLLRLANGIRAYALYVDKAFWPAALAVFYPHPGTSLPWWQVAVAALFVLAVSLAALHWRRAHPYFLVGWLWYLIGLLPVIGIIQVGGQAMADRYTYVPLLGIFLMTIWGLGCWWRRWRLPPALTALLATATVATLCLVTSRQVQVWRDTETLFRHALQVTANNYVAHNNLGNVLLRRGKNREAAQQFAAALAASRRVLGVESAQAHAGLGLVALQAGDLDAAIYHFRQALASLPNSAELHNNLAVALAAANRLEEAASHYRRALELNPYYAQAHANLGNLLLQRGELRQAAAHLDRALALDPNSAATHNSLGVALARQGLTTAAVAHFRRALEIDPAYEQARHNLAIAEGETQHSGEKSSGAESR